MYAIPTRKESRSKIGFSIVFREDKLGQLFDAAIFVQGCRKTFYKLHYCSSKYGLYLNNISGALLPPFQKRKNILRVSIKTGSKRTQNSKVLIVKNYKSHNSVLLIINLNNPFPDQIKHDDQNYNSLTILLIYNLYIQK